MKKPEVIKLLRAELDPTLRELGFRWRRMLRSSDGWYVRPWDGGRDTFGWGVASYFPRYNVSAFATLRLDAVEELVTAHIPFSPPEAAREAFTCNVNDALAFTDGPELSPGQTMGRAERTVESEEAVRALAEEQAHLIRERIDPWWRSLRTSEALWRADPSWRKFWGHPPHRQMHELALAFLCAPAEEQERLASEHLAAAQSWPEMHRSWLASLASDLRARRSGTQ